MKGLVKHRRAIIAILILLALTVYELRMISFFTRYFDATYKVVVAGIIALLLACYMLMFLCVGLYCFIYGIYDKSWVDVIIGTIVLLFVAIIAVGMYTYFSRSAVAAIAEGVLVFISIALFTITVTRYKWKRG